MTILRGYLLRQVLVLLGIGIAIFVGVLLLGNALKDVMAMLVNQQVSLAVVLKMLALLIPWVLVYALPLGFLAAVLLVFGRISADNELVAMRTGGVGLFSLVFPIMLLALLLCGVMAWINTDLSPRCRVAWKSLARAGVQNPADLLLPGRYIRQFPGWTIYIGGKDGEELKDVLLYKYEGGDLRNQIRADSAKVELDAETSEIRMQLTGVDWYYRLDGGSSTNSSPEWGTMLMDESSQTNRLGSLEDFVEQPDLSEMTFAQLRDELQLAHKAGEADAPIVFHLHRQVAVSFVCFAFGLVGVPLGIRAHRRETTVGLALALVMAVMYFGIQMFAQSLETNPRAYPHLIVWVPNLLFTAVGARLLWRANRGG
jgi:LPS export ABC transporter permease LptF